MAGSRRETRFTTYVHLPSPYLSPNSKSLKGRIHASSAYREHACKMAQHVLGKSTPPCWKSATVQATFIFPPRRRRRHDPDNLAASLKAAWDGLRDAGVIEDDSALTHKPVAVVYEDDEDLGVVRLDVFGLIKKETKHDHGESKTKSTGQRTKKTTKKVKSRRKRQ